MTPASEYASACSPRRGQPYARVAGRRSPCRTLEAATPKGRQPTRAGVSTNRTSARAEDEHRACRQASGSRSLLPGEATVWRLAHETLGRRPQRSSLAAPCTRSSSPVSGSVALRLVRGQPPDKFDCPAARPVENDVALPFVSRRDFHPCGLLSQLTCADRCRRRTVPAARRTTRPRGSCAMRHPRSSRRGSVAGEYLR
jgi:hypothetical protein